MIGMLSNIYKKGNPIPVGIKKKFLFELFVFLNDVCHIKNIIKKCFVLVCSTWSDQY